MKISHLCIATQVQEELSLILGSKAEKKMSGLALENV